jgi:hypothetical protein
MRHGAPITILALLLTALVLGTACEGEDDDPSSENTATAAGGGAEATTTPSGGGGQVTPEPTPSDGGENSITVSGAVSGSLTVEGMSCDFAGGATDTYIASISGTVATEASASEQFTIDTGGSQGEPAGIARLTRTNDYAKWSNEEQDGTPRAGSGTVRHTAQGGELSVDLMPALIDPGAAFSVVHLEGVWTCPNGSYTGAP